MINPKDVNVETGHVSASTAKQPYLVPNALDLDVNDAVLLSQTKKPPFYKSQKFRKYLSNTIIYIILIVMCLIWVAPILWMVMLSFSGNGQGANAYILPGIRIGAIGRVGTTPIYGFDVVGFSSSTTDLTKFVFTFNNYKYLFGLGSSPTAVTHALDNKFLIWFGNTIVIAIISTIVSTFFVLFTSYALSRFRFKGRKAMMQINLILGMFPGFVSMIILYWVMKEIFHLNGSFWSMAIIYCAGAGGGFYISKGFFDTIPKSIDEAAMIDGASKAQIFFNITIPLSKPIIVYTIITAFMGPWGDYITSSYIIGLQNIDQWTIPIGLYQMVSSNQYKQTYYSQFYAGAVVIAIPMIVLFMFMQKYYVGGVTGGSVKG